MKPSSSKYLLPALAALALGLVAAEGWLLQQSQLAATRALTALEQKKQERDWLARQSPALSEANEAALAADLAAAARVLAGLKQALPGPEAAPLPAKPIDAFFELAHFVEQLRTRAAQAQVGLKPDERFGFATHTNEGPAAEQLAAVHGQRRATQYLVETLLEARPLALLAVRRERPGADGPRDPRERAEDFFELDRGLSLRQPGQVETAAFRLEFTGQTATLRNFLNSLAAFRQPVVVRRVEVEPVDSTSVLVTPVSAGSPVPLVRPSLSKFVVVAEYALMIIDSGNAGP